MTVTCTTCTHPATAWCPGCTRPLCDTCWANTTSLCARCTLDNLDPATAWKAHAACNGMDGDLFFPERGGDVRAAKEVCWRCPVRDQCLEYALANGEKFGIWGGLSERERRRIRSTRRDRRRRGVA